MAPAHVWHFVPGSMNLSDKKLGRKLFFPGQYDVDKLLERVEKLPLRDRKYDVDLTGEPVFVEETPMYKRKMYKTAPVILPLKQRFAEIKTSVTITSDRK